MFGDCPAQRLGFLSPVTDQVHRRVGDPPAGRATDAITWRSQTSRPVLSRGNQRSPLFVTTGGAAAIAAHAGFEDLQRLELLGSGDDGFGAGHKTGNRFTGVTVAVDPRDAVGVLTLGIDVAGRGQVEARSPPATSTSPFRPAESRSPLSNDGVSM